jgi:hypothetical protein
VKLSKKEKTNMPTENTEHKLTFPVIERGTPNCFASPRDVALARGWGWTEKHTTVEATVEIHGYTAITRKALHLAWEEAFLRVSNYSDTYAESRGGQRMYYDREALVSMICQCHDAQDLEGMQFYVNMLRDLLAFSLE